jgi:hypothetical protein
MCRRWARWRPLSVAGAIGWEPKIITSLPPSCMRSPDHLLKTARQRTIQIAIAFGHDFERGFLDR